MGKTRLLILAQNGASTNIVYNSLKEDYDIEAVIVEKPIPKIEFLKKRIKKLGFNKVAGQILFQFTISKYLDLTSAKRKREILNGYGLNPTDIDSEKIIKLNSVNDKSTITLLQKINPELVVVNGTRIISREVLQCISARFINIHAGITPKYRNVHGAYWALVNNDMENCGVTVHLVDEGIDTGNIVYQERIAITDKDNFSTYPMLQLAEGIKLLKKTLGDISDNKLVFKKGTSESKIWHHPTFWQYLYQRIVHHRK
jgi:folate-dependent phosphoribosylglycinamide formyltransferase PurN